MDISNSHQRLFFNSRLFVMWWGKSVRIQNAFGYIYSILHLKLEDLNPWNFTTNVWTIQNRFMQHLMSYEIRLLKPPSIIQIESKARQFCLQVLRNMGLFLQTALILWEQWCKVHLEGKITIVIVVMCRSYRASLIRPVCCFLSIRNMFPYCVQTTTPLIDT